MNSCEINELAKEAANPILDEQEEEQPNKPASSAASFTSSISHKIKDQFARIRPRVQKPKQVQSLYMRFKINFSDVCRINKSTRKVCVF